jgi:hypothetical protein
MANSDKGERGAGSEKAAGGGGRDSGKPTSSSTSKPNSPTLIKKSAPTGHLPKQVSGGENVGASVPTSHLPAAKPSDGGGSGDKGGGSND